MSNVFADITASIKQTARDTTTLADELIFEPSLLMSPVVLEKAERATTQVYSLDSNLVGGPDISYQQQLLRDMVLYAVQYNKLNPAPPSFTVIMEDHLTAAEDWRKPRIALYRLFVERNRLEASTLVHLKTLEVSQLMKAYPTLGYSCCQSIAETWEQAFYRKFPEFAIGAGQQFEALAEVLNKANKSLQSALRLGALI